MKNEYEYNANNYINLNYEYYKNYRKMSSFEEKQDVYAREKFKHVAEKIAQTINPTSAFDIGCAFGVLIDELRSCGVNTYGIDILKSSDQKKFLSNKNDPLNNGECKHYDIIISIGVLEFVSGTFIDETIEKICSLADKVLFSSLDNYNDDLMLESVNSSVNWMKKFAQHGFFPNLIYDASYIAPYAVLFQRTNQSLDDAVLALYAQKQALSYALTKATAPLRNSIAVQEETMEVKDLKDVSTPERKQKTLKQSQVILAGVSSSLFENMALVSNSLIVERDERKRLEISLEAMHKSTSWKLTLPFRVFVSAIKGIFKKIRSVGAIFNRFRPFLPKLVSFLRDDDILLETPEHPSWFMIKAHLKDKSGRFSPVLLSGERGNYKPVPIRYIGRLGSHRFWMFYSLPGKSTYKSTLKKEAVYSLEVLRVSSFYAWGALFATTALQVKNRGFKTLFMRSIQVLREGNFIHRLTSHAAVDRNCDYTTWLAIHDSQDSSTLAKAKEWLAKQPYQPLISIIMPTYKSDPDLLRKAISSVQSQIYTNWELCIADDCSESISLKEFLEEEAKKDSRIRLCFREKNGHISAASNSALSLARGEFISLMDHDDEIHIFALALVVGELNISPDLDLIYTDEDKIDRNGERYDPYFKPEWNPELLFSQNYICHLGVYRRSIIEEIGGFREGYEGAQDYDLVLRFTEKTKRICRIPHVLYHWRAIEGSTALSENEKGYAHNKSVLALEDALKRRNIQAKVLETGFGSYHRIQYQLPENLPLISIIVPTKDRTDLLRVCLKGLLEQTDYDNMEIIIVDNKSTEKETFDFFNEVRNDSKVKILSYPKPFNYSAINNFAAAHAKGSILALMNNDIEIIAPGWLKEMVSHALRPEVGAVGARLYYPNDLVQHDGIIIGMGGVAGYAHPFIHRNEFGRFGRSRITQNYSAVTAAVLVVRTSIFRDVNGLDEVNLAVAFNDVDFCLRVKERGYLNVYTPFAELYHHESVSRGPDTTPDKIERFRGEVFYMMERWKTLTESDPYYNPNLPLRTDCYLDLDRHAAYPWDFESDE